MAVVDSTRAHAFLRKRWKGMMSRCYGRSAVAIKTYQSRGITVAPEWHDFDAFKAYMLNVLGLPDLDGGVRYALDRINNDDDYRPGNVRWATYKTNNRNSRNNRLVTYRGETMPVSELAERTGVPYMLLMDRIGRQRWDVEKAVNTPKLHKGARTVEYSSKHETMVTHDGETRSLAKWAKAYGLPLTTLRARYDAGTWDFDEALNTPPNKGNGSVRKAARFEFNGQMMTIREIADATGFHKDTLGYRIRKLKLSASDAILPLHEMKKAYRRLSSSLR